MLTFCGWPGSFAILSLSRCWQAAEAAVEERNWVAKPNAHKKEMLEGPLIVGYKSWASFEFRSNEAEWVY